MREWFRRLAAEMARRNEARFFEEIESAFQGLADRGFEITHRNYTDSSFGNGLIRYDNGSLAIEVIRDRSQHFVDFFVTHLPGQRFQHWVIRSHLGRPLPENAPDRPVRWLGRTVCEDLDEIAPLLRPDRAPETAESLARIYDEWFTARFVTPYRRDD